MTPAKQRRIDGFQTAFRVVGAELERARRWQQPERVKGFGVALALIDACICVEEAVPPFATHFDEQAVARLREIAIARDLLKRRAAENSEKPAELVDSAIVGEPLVQAVLARFPGAEIVDVVRRAAESTP